MRGLSPTRSAGKRLHSTIFPFGPPRIRSRRVSHERGAEFLAKQNRLPPPSYADAPARRFASGAGRPGRAFFSRTEGHDWRWASGPRRKTRRIFDNGPRNRSKPDPKRETRTPVTFETAAQLCPHQGVAENVAQAFGLIVPEYDAIRTEHTTAVKRMAEAFEAPSTTRRPPCTSSASSGPSSPLQSGPAVSTPKSVTQARDATARAADGGDDEHGAPIGLESKAQRTREFAADMAMQAYALLAATHGAIDAYKDLTGEDWKAYEAPARTCVEKKAAVSQMEASGGCATKGRDRKAPALLPFPAPRGAQPPEPSDDRLRARPKGR